jgi:hypothetical protein
LGGYERVQSAVDAEKVQKAVDAEKVQKAVDSGRVQKAVDSGRVQKAKFKVQSAKWKRMRMRPKEAAVIALPCCPAARFHFFVLHFEL